MYVCTYLLSPHSELPSYDAVIPALLQYGVQELPNKCKLTPGQFSKQLKATYIYTNSNSVDTSF